MQQGLPSESFLTQWKRVINQSFDFGLLGGNDFFFAVIDELVVTKVINLEKVGPAFPWAKRQEVLLASTLIFFAKLRPDAPPMPMEFLNIFCLTIRRLLQHVFNEQVLKKYGKEELSDAEYEERRGFVRVFFDTVNWLSRALEPVRDQVAGDKIFDDIYFKSSLLEFIRLHELHYWKIMTLVDIVQREELQGAGKKERLEYFKSHILKAQGGKDAFVDTLLKSGSLTGDIVLETTPAKQVEELVVDLQGLSVGGAGATMDQA